MEKKRKEKEEEEEWGEQNQFRVTQTYADIRGL
jgi:hypothetical protein